MILRKWAAKWNVPLHCILDLENEIGLAAGATPQPKDDSSPFSETRQQNLIRLEATQKDMILFRNNVGALIDSRGVPVRYGLANESKQMNARIKSGDLIGVQRVLITPDMVGQTIGQFVSVEVKKENWTYSGSAHEIAQTNWINLILKWGGRALFANKEGML